jgi:lipopolysaccharide transport system permease protein
LLGIILFSVGSISVYIVFVPVYFVILMLFTLGAAWFVASLNVFIRDTAQVLSVVLTFWFWFTPIFYTPDRFPPDLLFLVRWNPLAHVVIAYRDCLLRMRMPDLGTLALLGATSLVIFALGGLFFRYTKREFVDVL